MGETIDKLKNESPHYSTESYQELENQIELAKKTIDNSDAIAIPECNKPFSNDIYTLQGLSFGNNIDYHSLPKGIYIFNWKLIMKK